MFNTLARKYSSSKTLPIKTFITDLLCFTSSTLTISIHTTKLTSWDGDEQIGQVWVGLKAWVYILPGGTVIYRQVEDACEMFSVISTFPSTTQDRSATVENYTKPLCAYNLGSPWEKQSLSFLQHTRVLKLEVISLDQNLNSNPSAVPKWEANVSQDRFMRHHHLRQCKLCSSIKHMASKSRYAMKRVLIRWPTNQAVRL